MNMLAALRAPIRVKRRILLSVLAVVCAGVAGQSYAQSCSAGSAIQTQLNSLASTGGKVSLPCGCWTLTQTLVMPSHTALEGEGICTVIYGPPAGTAIVGDYNARRYGLAVRELLIDGRAPGATQDGYIALDFRNVSLGRVRDVYIEDVQTGILLWTSAPTNGAYYNVIEDVVITSSATGIEILGGANENIVRGGKIASSGTTATMTTGILIQGNTNVKIEGTSIERLCRSFNANNPCSRGIHLGTGAAATKIESVRLEDTDIGVHLGSGSTDAVGVSQYCTNNTADRKNDAVSYRWVGTGCGSEN